MTISADFRRGFLRFANASVEMTLRSDFLKPSPWGGKVDCRSDSEGKTDEGSGYDKRNVKDNPSSVAMRQVSKGKPCKIGAFLVRLGATAGRSAMPTYNVEK